jgi:hypothetical protein
MAMYVVAFDDGHCTMGYLELELLVTNLLERAARFKTLEMAEFIVGECESLWNIQEGCRFLAVELLIAI